MMSTKIFMIAGEASGDLLGGRVASQILKHDPTISLFGWGGSNMSGAGVHISRDMSGMQFMGFWESVLKLPEALQLLQICKKDINRICPDLVVFIDFGGFNLRMARWCKQNGYKTAYYSPPKVWASREGRITQIQKFLDLVVVLFPFEYEYFKNKGINVRYYGNGLANHIRAAAIDKDPLFRSRYRLDGRPICALLPGSRIQEIKYVLPILGSFAKRYPNYNWCIAVASQIKTERILKYLTEEELRSHLTIIEDDTYELLAHSEYAILTSGTASLEAALFNVPQIVCYKTHFVNYMIAKRLIRVPHISLVNLICQQDVVEELIQGRLNIDELTSCFEDLHQPVMQQRQRLAYARIRDSLHEKTPEMKIAKSFADLAKS